MRVGLLPRARAGEMPAATAAGYCLGLESVRTNGGHDMSGSLRHVLAAAVIAVPAIAATPVLGQTDGADGQIAIDATALYMRRAAPDSAPIVSTVPGAGDIANASQISPGWSAAVEGRVGFESGDRLGRRGRRPVDCAARG